MLAGLAGALLTLIACVLVMLVLAREPGAGLASARGTGTRLVAYVMMLVGGIAGAALGPGFELRRRPPLWKEPPAGIWEGHYPLSWLGAVAAAVAALTIAFPLAAQVEEFLRVVLVLLSPSVERASGWVSLFIVLAVLALCCRELMRLLDHQIYRARTAPARADAEHEPALAPIALTDRQRAFMLLDSILRIGLSMVLCIGLTLRLAAIAAAVVGATGMMGYPWEGSESTIFLAAVGSVIVGAAGGMFLGWRLDLYFRRRMRPRVVPPGAIFGYTPIAWVGGILAAKLFSGVAIALASIVFLPVELRRPSDNSGALLIMFYVFAVAAWLFVIGRAAARGIDALIRRGART